MLYRASVQDVRQGAVTRRRGHIVVVMQFYPRFLPKDLVDEYARALAPERSLFQAFKARERESGDHDGAFDEVQYESRFDLTPAGWSELERLVELSRERSVFLVCQCALNQKCHADLLLLAANHRFRAEIPALRIHYPRFRSALLSSAPQS